MTTNQGDEPEDSSDSSFEIHYKGRPLYSSSSMRYFKTVDSATAHIAQARERLVDSASLNRVQWAGAYVVPVGRPK